MNRPGVSGDCLVDYSGLGEVGVLTVVGLLRARAGGRSPQDSSSRRWLNQSTHSQGGDLDVVDGAPRAAAA